MGRLVGWSVGRSVVCLVGRSVSWSVLERRRSYTSKLLSEHSFKMVGNKHDNTARLYVYIVHICV